MTRFRLSLILVIVLTALLGGVTGAGATPPKAPASEEPGAQAPDTQPAEEPGAEEDCSPFTEFDAANFSDSTDIDNTFLPLKPGTRRVLMGVANRTGEPLDHTVTFTVTDVVKVIDGVRTLAVWDVDENAGELVEEELAFWAQDDEGNVWNLGEYPEEFDAGEFTGAPNTWIQGIEDAEGGVHMPAKPQLGDDYRQGSVPSIEFLDCAFVFEKDLSVCVPFDCYEGVLVTHERSPLDPAGGIQTKAHAPGVGIVEIDAIDDPEGETLALEEFAELDEAELQEARDNVLRLDARGFENSEIYAQTEPAIAPPTDGDGGGGGDPGDGGGEPVPSDPGDGGGHPVPPPPAHGDDDGDDKDHGDKGDKDDKDGDKKDHDKGDKDDDKPKDHGDKDEDKDHGDKDEDKDRGDKDDDRPKDDGRHDDGDDRHDEGDRDKGDDDRHKGDDKRDHGDRDKGDDDRRKGDGGRDKGRGGDDD